MYCISEKLSNYYKLLVSWGLQLLEIFWIIGRIGCHKAETELFSSDWETNVDLLFPQVKNKHSFSWGSVVVWNRFRPGVPNRTGPP